MNQAGVTTTTVDHERPVIQTLVRSAQALFIRLEGSLATVGLSMPKFIVLDHLVRSGENLTLGELATRIACVRSNITQLVDRLEGEGLVQRVNDPDDRRSIRAAITRLGIAKHSEGARVLDEEEERLARQLSASDLDRLLELLDGLHRSNK